MRTTICLLISLSLACVLYCNKIETDTTQSDYDYEIIRMLNGKWYQTKIIRVMDNRDTTPKENCYLKINNNVIQYLIQDCVLYADTLILDTTLLNDKFVLRGHFKMNHYDLFDVFVIDNDTIFSISKFFPDGDAEIFRKRDD